MRTSAAEAEQARAKAKRTTTITFDGVLRMQQTSFCRSDRRRTAAPVVVAAAAVAQDCVAAMLIVTLWTQPRSAMRAAVVTRHDTGT
jgi:hypothetical protein